MVMDTSSLVGQVIPHTYNVAYIILAYFVCLSGCLTSLELLHRRTSTRGLYNWFLLLGAATSMGAVAIWSMHYIGDQAIEMMRGQPEFRISYRPEFTAGSFALPIGAVALAFYYFHQLEAVSVKGTIIGGFMIGLAACGMHYTGEGGISNYEVSYKSVYVFASAIIAVIANTIGLGIFFHLHSAWKDIYLKRLACASFLAAAVTGMHWVASFGTLYHLKGNSKNDDSCLSREAIVIIVMTLSIGCCVFLFALAVIGRHSKQKVANRAREVVLACAMFDPQGRIMVTPDGLLPSRKVTNAYIEGALAEIFEIGHPVFCWVFRASRCWQAVSDHVPGVRAHLRATSVFREYHPESRSNFNDLSSFNLGEGVEDCSLLFKELFCVAAQDLANLIQKPLGTLGVLFEGIMDTGTLHMPTSKLFSKTHIRPSLIVGAHERQDDRHVVGRGQLLFTVRRLSGDEVSEMQASGFRFAFLCDIGQSLALSLEVTKRELSNFVTRLWHYSEKEPILEQGVYLACFALRPLCRRGFDVLVRRDAKSILPIRQLPISKLKKWQKEFLKRLDNCTIATCCVQLRRRSLCHETRELEFASQLCDGIMDLAKNLGKPYFQDAQLIARPFETPCHVRGESHTLESASIIAFRIIVDAHEPTILNRLYEFNSSRFFLSQQHALKGSPDCETFGRIIHQELAGLMRNVEPLESTRAARRTRNMPYLHVDFHRLSPSLISPSTWSIPNNPRFPVVLAEESQVSPCVSMPKNMDLGSSSASMAKEVTGNDRGNEDTHHEAIEMVNQRLQLSAGETFIENETFADELMAFTIGERIHHHSLHA